VVGLGSPSPHDLKVSLIAASPSRPLQTSHPSGSPQIAWFHTLAAEPEMDGPVFLLIHGVGLSHRSFSRLARELAQHGPVLAPDLPGFGFAPGARRRVSIDEMATALLPGLDRQALDGRRLVILGHSLGAEVAVEIARLRPELTRGVVLVGPVVDPHAATAFGQARRLLLDMWHEPPRTGAMVARDYVRGGLLSFAAGVDSMLRYDITQRIGAVTAPVFVLRGARDPVAPSSWADRLSDLAVDGRTVDIPGAVHNVPHSHPRDTARHIITFAASLSPRTTPATDTSSCA
jgi:pimeloyl-ACP methyl ester carboxylesterase